MNQRDAFRIVMQATKELESLLEQRFGAEGRGLHGKLDSVEGLLDEAVVKKIRFIATIRNKLYHEADFKDEDVPLDRFVRAHQQVMTALAEVDAHAARNSRRRVERRPRRGTRGRQQQELHRVPFSRVLLVGLVVLVALAVIVSRSKPRGVQPALRNVKLTRSEPSFGCSPGASGSTP